CTVALDGQAARSCLMLALQAEGCSVETVESLCLDGGALGPLQQAMADAHSFQCAFCAPGFLMTVHCLLAEQPDLTRDQIREELSGNLCRCTGYQSIVDGVEAAIAALGAGLGLLATGGRRWLRRWPAGVPAAGADPARPGGGHPESGIEHIVVVMMENRSFDHFLGWLPGADGTQDVVTPRYPDQQGLPR